MNIEGKTAFVTGAGSGIGAGIAEALVESGARVVLADINVDWAISEAARIGGETFAVEIDVASPESWSSAKAKAQSHFGQVDILCNNAGVATPRMPLEDVPDEMFEHVMAINVAGVFNGIKAFVPEMKARRCGHIVNTSSVNGLIPFGSFTTYSASKFAVTGLSEGLRQELEPFDVGVSILYPGLTKSRMSMSQEDGVGTSSEMLALMMEPIWLGRAVVKAIVENRLHLITHPDHLPTLEERLAELSDAFGEPAQPGFGGGRTF
jgi:NAD(P)-dependent dehydrogenase (short-subunit alcohol dehydrogenase family)